MICRFRARDWAPLSQFKRTPLSQFKQVFHNPPNKQPFALRTQFNRQPTSSADRVRWNFFLKALLCDTSQKWINEILALFEKFKDTLNLEKWNLRRMRCLLPTERLIVSQAASSTWSTAFATAPKIHGMSRNRKRMKVWKILTGPVTGKTNSWYTRLVKCSRSCWKSPSPKASTRCLQTFSLCGKIQGWALEQDPTQRLVEPLLSLSPFSMSAVANTMYVKFFRAFTEFRDREPIKGALKQAHILFCCS